MSGSDRASQVTDVAQQVVGPFDLVVEDVTITPIGSRRLVRIAVDRALDDPTLDETSPIEAVSLDEIAEASRHLGAALDEADVMGVAPYVLEVSSPGTDRPLRHWRHFRRNVGRLLDVVTADGARVTGRLNRVSGDALTLLAADASGMTIPLQDIRQAHVQVEFGSWPDPDAQEL